VVLSDLNEAVEVLRSLQRVREPELEVLLLSLNRPGLVHGEGVQSGYRHLLGLPLLNADGAPIPAELQLGGILAALDASDDEGVRPTVRLVRPLDLEGLLLVGHLQQL